MLLIQVSSFSLFSLSYTKQAYSIVGTVFSCSVFLIYLLLLLCSPNRGRPVPFSGHIGPNYRPIIVIFFVRLLLMLFLSMLGLTMSIDRRENNIVYFTINHNDEEYRKMHKQYIVNAWLAWTQNVLRDIDINDSLRSMHVEEMVEVSSFIYSQIY